MDAETNRRLTALEDELGRLRSVRRSWRHAAAGLGVALLALATLGQATPPPKELTVEKLIVRGADEKSPRVEVAGGKINVIAADGEARGTFGIGLQGPLLHLVDGPGAGNAVLAYAHKGGTHLELRYGLSHLTRLDSGGLTVLRKTEGAAGGFADLVRLGASEHGGVIHVYNKTKEGVVDINADEYGHGYIGVFDRKGKGRTLTPR